MEKKTYVFVSGKHTGPDGTIYKKGDKIDLTEDEAKGLVNKIIDPEAQFGVSVQSDNSQLLARIAELEAENAELKEAIDAESED